MGHCRRRRCPSDEMGCFELSRAAAQIHLPVLRKCKGQPLCGQPQLSDSHSLETRPLLPPAGCVSIARLGIASESSLQDVHDLESGGHWPGRIAQRIGFADSPRHHLHKRLMNAPDVCRIEHMVNVVHHQICTRVFFGSFQPGIVLYIQDWHVSQALVS